MNLSKLRLDSKKLFKEPNTRILHRERWREPWQSPLSERTFTGWGLVTDIMKEASYGALNTLALKWLKVIETFIHRYNFLAPFNSLPPVPASSAYHLITRSRVPRALPVGINEGMRVLFHDKQLLAYICGSDKAVAGDVNRFTTFSAIS